MRNSGCGCSQYQSHSNSGEKVTPPIRARARKNGAGVLSVRLQGVARRGTKRILEYSSRPKGSCDAFCNSDTTGLGQPTPRLWCDPRSSVDGVEFFHCTVLQSWECSVATSTRCSKHLLRRCFVLPGESS